MMGLLFGAWMKLEGREEGAEGLKASANLSLSKAVLERREEFLDEGEMRRFNDERERKGGRGRMGGWGRTRRRFRRAGTRGV